VSLGHRWVRFMVAPLWTSTIVINVLNQSLMFLVSMSLAAGVVVSLVAILSCSPYSLVVH